MNSTMTKAKIIALFNQLDTEDKQLIINTLTDIVHKEEQSSALYQTGLDL